MSVCERYFTGYVIINIIIIYGNLYIKSWMLVNIEWEYLFYISIFYYPEFCVCVFFFFFNYDDWL